MPRRARVHYVSLRSSLVNLPISIYGPLLERNVRPQHVAVLLTCLAPAVRNEKGRIDAYVGWTGMLASSSIAHFNAGSDTSLETVEIDPQYGQALGLSEGDLVEIGLLHDLPFAKSVSTEPATPDDWEILELHAEHVEATLLSQVRVAAPGQEIDVWAMGRTRIRLRVESLNPSDAKALLLTTDTEVSIAPKTRRTPPAKAAAQDIPFDDSSDTKTPKRLEYVHAMRVLPASVLPVTLPNPPDLQTIAYVSRGVLRARAYEGLVPEDLNNLRGTVRRMLPPPDPTESGTMPEEPPEEPRTLDLKGEKKADAKEDEKKKDEWDVVVKGVDEVPPRQVVLAGGLSGVDDWDVVRLAIFADPDPPSKQVPPVVPEPRTPPPIHSLSGLDELLKNAVEWSICMYMLWDDHMIRGSKGLLVTGRPGAGKTSVAKAIAKTLLLDPYVYAFNYYVDVTRWTEKPITKVRDQLHFWLDKALWHRPSVIIFDNLDKLLPVEAEHADSFRTRVLTELFVSMFSAQAHDLAPDTSGVIIIGTAESQSSLHPLLGTMHVFKETVKLKAPDRIARKEILANAVKRHMQAAPTMVIDPAAPLNYASLASETDGYLAMDLHDLVDRAVHEAAARLAAEPEHDDAKIVLTAADFTAAHVGFVPLSLRDVPLQTSTVQWSDIGGLSQTRRVLRETIEWPTKYAPIFAQSPLRLRQGLLLYGYPGCGKTMLASAVAKECGLNFISVKGPELLNKYIGASEKSVRDIFERANAAKPCVLFFDEFESIAPKRGHDSTGVTDRVVNQLLTLLDGAEGLDGVYVLAATSRPDLIDSALLRPGRLDKSLLCNMPTTEERKEILQAHARKVPISPSVDFASLAEMTEGYSGADLQALLYNAHLDVVHASIKDVAINKSSSLNDLDDEPVDYISFGGPPEEQKIVKSRAEEVAFQRRLRDFVNAEKNTQQPAKNVAAELPKHVITEEHLLRVLKTTRPSVPASEVARLDRIYSAFISDRSGDLPQPPDAGGVGKRVSLM
ncbi:AAA-domain-containing protein [Dentipellis sp. KUC8613]|nr:AAA-domain-containing protein [Dentipellis sp. KUC8613]